MFANDFCTPLDKSGSDKTGNAEQQTVTISARQASRFAKTVAGDFNPLHDEDAKRFCVPGDLLFALVLQNHGLFQHMAFSFLELLPADMELDFHVDGGESIHENNSSLSVSDPSGKTYLSVLYEGQCSQDQAQIESLVRSYVAFSGQNFPHILVPLMQDKGVMINPSRPLVVYESMSFELDTLAFDQPALSLSSSELEIDGKRGNAFLYFDVHCNGDRIGRGRKKLVLGGLRPYEEESLSRLVNDYLARQSAATTR